jgi:FtsH-binding integral membrane protein
VSDRTRFDAYAAHAPDEGIQMRGVPAAMATFVQRTYSLLAFSLILGAGVAWAVIRWMPIQEIALRGGGTAMVPALPAWVHWTALLGFVGFALMGQFVRSSGARSGEASPLGLVALGGMVVCSGVMVGPLVGTYIGLGMTGAVAAAGITTAVTFSLLTAFVLVTGKDFSFLRGILFVGILGLIAARLVSWFVPMPAGFSWWYSAVACILFCGYILYDTSNVVRVYGPANLIVPAVIALYLDILNLFLHLLQLFAGSRRNGSS